MLTVWRAVRSHLIGDRDLIIDSPPILAWCRKDPDAASGHAPAHHPRPRLARLSRAYLALSRLWIARALPALARQCPRCPLCPPEASMGQAPLSHPPSHHPAGCGLLLPSADPLDPRCSGSRCGGSLESQAAEKPLMFATDVDIRGIGPAAAPLNASRGRVFLYFRLQRPPYSGWSTIVRQVALTYTASIVVALAAWQVHRPDLIRSPKRVLAHLWEDSQV